MGKLGQGMSGDVSLNLLPLIFKVPYFLAIGTNRQESFQESDPFIQFLEQTDLNYHDRGKY